MYAGARSGDSLLRLASRCIQRHCTMHQEPVLFSQEEVNPFAKNGSCRRSGSTYCSREVTVQNMFGRDVSWALPVPPAST